METKHTPLPWNYQMITEGYGKRSIHSPYICAGEEIISKIIVHGNDGKNINDEDRENGKFIVRAVNSHYGLLDAVKSYLSHAEEMSFTPDDAWAEKVKKLEILIAKAEGGAK